MRDVPPINAGLCDTVVGLEFLEHLDANDRLVAIKEASGLCQRAIFSVPDNCMSPEDVIEHRVVFDKTSFGEFLGQAFENVQVVPVSDKGIRYLVGICEHA